MPAKWNFLPSFIFLILWKNNSSKVKDKTQNTLMKWDTQSSEELVLKAVSATFLLVCFLSLNESICQTRKNVFYFI